MQAALRLMEAPSLDVTAILVALGKAIGTAKARLQQMEKKWDGSPETEPPWDEQGQIEHLLGLGFVAAQVYVTQIADSCSSLHDTYKSAHGSELLGHNGSRDSVMTRSNPMIAGTNVTSVFAVDTIANYYKHRDEWRKDWQQESLNKWSRGTIETLATLGFGENSAWVLLHAFKLIVGHDRYEGLMELGLILERWKDDLLTTYRKTLGFGRFD